MSQVEVDKIIPQSGTTLTIGDSGDTITIASGATLSGDLNASNLTSGTVPDARISGTYTGITGLDLTDNSKIRLGTGNDLQIYHTGSGYVSNYIDVSNGDLLLRQTGSNDIYLQSNSDIFIGDVGNNEKFARFIDNGTVELYHDGSKKFETTSTGVAVTGTLTTGAITSTGNFTFNVADGMNINTKESLNINIDSDDNDSSRAFALTSGSGGTSETLISASEDAGVNLYYDNSKKFETTSSGATVTGSAKISTSSSGVTPNGNADELFVENSGNAGITIGSGTANSGQLCFGDSGDNNVGEIAYLHDVNAMRFSVNGPEKMRIDSSGRLNIGTSTSISGSLLNINGGFINADVTDNSHKFIRSTTATTGLGDPMICRVNTSADMADGFASVITFQVSDSGVSNSSLGFIGATRSGADNSGSLIFHTYNNGSQSEKVRITSAGNVGIGTTSPVGVVGTDKVLEIKGSSNPGLVINDTGQAEKYAFHALATKLNMYYGATAFLTYDASTSGVGINNASPSQSLDVTGSIEVSDGIYLGGTGTANKLSDYEEGTWTPVYSPATGSFTSVTYNIQRGTYTKVGRQVTLLLQLRTNAITVGTASGALYVEGLPFTASSDSAKITYTPLGIRTGWTNNPSTLRTQVSSTYARVSENFDNTATEVSDMNTGSNGNFLALEFTYFTD